jgi:hypothetical protein
MSARSNGAFAVLGFVLFLTACGDLGMVLPSQGSYRVNAQVDGDYTLDTYSVVTKNSMIRPYFVNSVVNDPDVRGITVFVQDYSGAVVSRKVHYLLAEEERPKPPEPPVEPPPDITETDQVPGDESSVEGAADPAAPDSAEAREDLPGAPEDPALADLEDGSPEAPADSGTGDAVGTPDGADAAHSPGATGDTAWDLAPADTAGQDYTNQDHTGGDGAYTTGAAPQGTDSAYNSGMDTQGGAAQGTDAQGTDNAYNSGMGSQGMDAQGTDGAYATGADAQGGAAQGTDSAYNSGMGSQSGDSAYTTGMDTSGSAQGSAQGTGIAAGDAQGPTWSRDDVYADSAHRDTVNADAADYSDTNSDTAGTEFMEASGSAQGGVRDSDPAEAESGNTDAADNDRAGTDIAKAEGDNTDTSGSAQGSAQGPAQGMDASGKDASGMDAQGIDAQGTDIVKTESTPADTAVPPLPPRDANPQPLPEDETVIVKQLDQRFPEFRILEDLAIGRYNLVFQVMGEREILYKTFKPIYFIGDAKFTLGEIQSFLPVEITGGRLIPPGINVMLATEVSADPRLDPYVIWHNGKKIIAQGRLSDGANSLFWRTPEQTGFHSIRVEVFPLLPEDRVPGNMIGKIKELSLPVSSRSERVRHFRDSAGNPGGEFLGWYQFWGTLDDTKAPNNPGRKLVSLYAQAPRWIPLGGIYGLLVGRDDVYTLPGAPFIISGNEQGRGRLLFHLGALSEGPVVSLRFAGEGAAESRETVDLDLSFVEDTLILRIASRDASREEYLGLHDYEAHGFITAIVEFTIAPDRFDAELFLENPPATTGPLSIALATAVSGEGSIRFGEYLGQGGRRVASRAAGKNGNGTLALNELAFSYTRTPIPPKEEPSESGLPETLAAEEEVQGAKPETLSQNAL